MKSLSLSRPLVITVIGLPGSGKSFFARQFADMFGAPLVSPDFIRHSLYEKSSYAPEEDAQVLTIMQHEIKELLKTGKTIIVDGGLNNRTPRHAIEKLAVSSGYGKLTIWVQTDEPTSLQRSKKRNAKNERDALNSPMDTAAFERYKKQFSNPIMSENIVVISGKHTYATQARVVLKKLVSPRDTTMTDPHHTTERTSPSAEPHRRSVTIN